MGKQRFGCIYRLTNTTNGMTYIGKSIHFRQRMSEHKRSHKKLKTYLSRAILKYGWDAFKKEIIIDNIPEGDLDNLEISYIDVENTMAPNGYNLTRGGEGTSGMKHSAATKEKHRKFMIEKHSKRKQVGHISFHERPKKWLVYPSRPEKKYIGRYSTKKKAVEALKLYNETGERIESDRKFRKSGTGCVCLRPNGTYRAQIKKNKKVYCKAFATEDEAEAFLDKFVKHFNSTGNIMDYGLKKRRKMGTGQISRTPNGRYRAVFKQNGKRKGKTFDTVGECEAWLKSMVL